MILDEIESLDDDEDDDNDEEDSEDLAEDNASTVSNFPNSKKKNSILDLDSIDFIDEKQRAFAKKEQKKAMLPSQSGIKDTRKIKQTVQNIQKQNNNSSTDNINQYDNKVDKLFNKQNGDSEDNTTFNHNHESISQKIEQFFTQHTQECADNGQIFNEITNNDSTNNINSNGIDNFAPITLKDKIAILAEKSASKFNCEIIDLKVIARIEKILITIGKLDYTSVTMSQCVDINQDFCRLLDLYLPNVRIKFNIEISSAGINRVLKNLKDFTHHIGSRIGITTYTDNPNHTQYNIGYLLYADETTIVYIAETIAAKLHNKDEIYRFLHEIAQHENITLTYKNQHKMPSKQKIPAFISDLIRVRSSILQKHVANINNSIKITELDNKMHCTHINCDKIMKVKLEPLL